MILSEIKTTLPKRSVKYIAAWQRHRFLQSTLCKVPAMTGSISAANMMILFTIAKKGHDCCLLLPQGPARFYVVIYSTSMTYHDFGYAGFLLQKTATSRVSVRAEVAELFKS